ncbi:MAG TPA: M23 family metallopeptidase [Verrucomicrobiae bacterium]|nr:M23 family metallopeptidase [Verrucomicrobiae bacterium]
MTKNFFSVRNAIIAFQITAAIGGGMLAGALCRMDHPEGRGAVATDFTNVKISTQREGDVTRVYVQNQERTEVAMTFDFHVVNLKSTVKFPYTATFAPGETEAFTLSPENAEKPWEYSFTNYYKLGSTVAVPDDYVYSLPYAPGKAHKVTQAFGGSFSHKGSNKYAIDWKMPEGTTVYAARGGEVVKIKDDSDIGGGSLAYDRFNNYVLIRHSDGTLGHYCHLKKGGVKVVPGQIVHAGDPIALSGNTGFSSGPHLHFAVFKAVDGKHRESLPIVFKDASGENITLVEGRSYKAATIRTVQSAPAERTAMLR